LALLSSALAYLAANHIASTRKPARKHIDEPTKADILEYIGMAPKENRFKEKMPDWANAWAYATQKRMDNAGVKIPFGH